MSYHPTLIKMVKIQLTTPNADEHVEPVLIICLWDAKWHQHLEDNLAKIFNKMKPD